VIDIDNGDNDDDNLAVLAEIAHKHDKGKALEAVHEDVLGKIGVLKSTRARRKSAAASSLTITDEPENETLRKLRSFKQFDTVTDTSDHHFIKSHSSMAQVSFSKQNLLKAYFVSILILIIRIYIIFLDQNPKSWATKIQEEWKILEKHLPGEFSILVTK